MKDLFWLRPFDVDRAKAGEPICTLLDEARTFVMGPDAAGRVITETPYGFFVLSDTFYLRMAPLCWVEGRPVYRGHLLYCEKAGGTVIAQTWKDGCLHTQAGDTNVKVKGIEDEFSWIVPDSKV